MRLNFLLIFLFSFKESKISSSSTIRAKNLVSKLSKLAKRKVINELRILSRKKSKRIVNNDKHQFSMNDDSSKNKLSSGSPSVLMISKEYKNVKSSLLNDNNKQMVMNEHQNIECSLSNNSVIIRVDEEYKSLSPVSDLSLKRVLNYLSDYYISHKIDVKNFFTRAAEAQ